MNEIPKTFNGIFQYDTNTPSHRLVWTIIVLVCIFLLSIAICDIFFDIIELQPNIEHYYFKRFSIIFFSIVLPIFFLIIGFPRVYRKIGVDLQGARFTNQGIEIGALLLNSNCSTPDGLWEQIAFESDVVAKWTKKKCIDTGKIDFEIILRTEGPDLNLFFLERFVVLKNSKATYQLFGKTSNENVYQDILAICNGSLRLLEDANGIPPDKLSSLLEMLADIIAICNVTHTPHCNLKIISTPVNHGNALATGVLGGLTTQRNSEITSKKTSSDCCFNENFSKYLSQFTRERNWTYSTE